MSSIRDIMSVIRRTVDCTVDSPVGQPVLRDGDHLPADLREFYEICGGVTFFARSDYSVRIVSPRELTRANPEILFCEYPEDITDTWYIVARGGSEEKLSIDCSLDRLGQCYDSFWDRHGMAGDCAVIALTFTELLQRLLDNRGDYWYWFGPNRPDYGDAYDEKNARPRRG